MTDPTVEPTTVTQSGTSPTDPTIPGTSGCLTQLDTSSTSEWSTTEDITFIEPDTGACLSPPDTWGLTTTGTSVATESSGDSSDGSGDSSTGAAADPNSDRGRILERLHRSGVLPKDLLDQLKRG